MYKNSKFAHLKSWMKKWGLGVASVATICGTLPTLATTLQSDPSLTITYTGEGSVKIDNEPVLSAQTFELPPGTQLFVDAKANEGYRVDQIRTNGQVPDAFEPTNHYSMTYVMTEEPKQTIEIEFKTQIQMDSDVLVHPSLNNVEPSESAELSTQNSSSKTGQTSARDERKTIVFNPETDVEALDASAISFDALYALANRFGTSTFGIEDDYVNDREEVWKEFRFALGDATLSTAYLDEDGFLPDAYFEAHQEASTIPGCYGFLNRKNVKSPKQSLLDLFGLPTAGPSSVSLAYRAETGLVPLYGAQLSNYEFRITYEGQTYNAFCGNYLYAGPEQGSTSASVTRSDNLGLRKVLYYGYGGPQNILGSQYKLSTVQQLLVTDDMVSQAMSSACITQNLMNGVMWNDGKGGGVWPIWKHIIDDLPAPPDNYHVYVANFSGSGMNYQGQTKPYQPLAWGLHEDEPSNPKPEPGDDSSTSSETPPPTPKPGRIRFSKEIQGGSASSGPFVNSVAFSVFKRNGSPVAGLTVGGGREIRNGVYQFSANSQTGTMTLGGIYEGEYYLQEVEASEDIVSLDSNKYYFEVDFDGDVDWDTTLPNTILNTALTTTVDIAKEDTQTQAPVLGAKLELIQVDDQGQENVIDTWTTDGTDHALNDPQPGQYILREVEAPDGYALAKDASITVEKGKDHKFVMKEDTVKVIKRNQLGEYVADVVLTVTDSEGNPVDTWTTGQPIVEWDETIQTAMDTQDHLEWDGPLAGKDAEDPDKQAHFILNKIGESPYGLVQGSSIDDQVCTVDRNDVDTVLKNAQSLLDKADDLDASAKEAIDQAMDALKAAQSKGISPLNAIEALKTALQKAGLLADHQNLMNLDKTPAAVGPDILYQLIIQDEDGKVSYYEVNQDGIEMAHFVRGLKEGETYTLQETSAPEGYKDLQTLTFTVDGQMRLIVVDNTKTADVEISKKDITGTDELPGAKLEIQDEDGNTLHQWTSGTKPETISDLEVGKAYTLIETTAPEGYDKTESITFTVYDHCGDIQHVTMYDAHLPETNEPPKQVDKTEKPGKTRTPKPKTGLDTKAWGLGLLGAAMVLIGAIAYGFYSRKKH